jgi:guanosine-3',5'-bis(diphosphate) 3'-pyrophosphohydrolase
LQVVKASTKSHDAKLVKLADKICNMRDIATSPPADWNEERKVEYFEWARNIVEGMRGTNVALETKFEEICDTPMV